MASPAMISSRYEIRGIVGRGGMGLVYRALDRIIGREVALKTLADVQGKVAVEMFYKEWQILANLHHPNIIEIFDIGEFDEGGETKPFFVMPLLPGMTLDQLMRLPKQPLAPERLCEIVSQVCRGLQAIHDTGLVHRDVKPSNIFVMEGNAVKIIDFGVAHLLGGNTVTGLKGTVNYMAPEQIQSQECSAASDIFSLGVVCYEALCGVRPFQGKSSEAVFDAILHHIPPPVCEINPVVSQTVSRVIHKSLAKHPRHRYASAVEFAETLQKAFRGEPIPALDPSRIQPRIQRAIRAFEQGNHQMASEILSDLEAAGHIDPALQPLRKQIDQTLQRNNIRDLLTRARMGIEEEEFTLALQNVDAALRIEPSSPEVIRLREQILAKIAERDVAEWLHGAEEAINGYAFSRARQLLRSVLDQRPGDARATSLFQELETREQAYREARQEKEELYRAAREAWENAEYATASAKLERVLQLESNAPDTSTPDSGANYSTFLSLVRSAQMIIENTQAAALAYMAEGRYEAAAELCRDCTSRYPGHPVPQGLALLAEAERKRETLTRMSETIRAISAESDLEKKLELIKRGMEEFPAEPMFEQWMRPVRDLLAQTRAIIAKAQEHEEHSRFEEALEEWRMLGTIYPQFAGLQAALARTQGRVADPGATKPAPASVPAPLDFGQDSAVTLPVNSAADAKTKVAGTAAAPVESPGTPSVREPAGTIAALRRALEGMTARLPRTPHVLKQAGWAAATGIAVLLIIAAALVTAARRDSKAPVKAVATRAKIVLHASDGDAAIRVGDTVVPLRNGEAQAELVPGTYPVTAEKDGYERYTGTVKLVPGGVDHVIPPLRPLPTSIYVSADLQQGRVRIDNGQPVSLVNAEFHLETLAPGDHTLSLSDGRSEAKLAFSTADGQPPQLKGSPEARELQAFVVTGLGRAARVTGSVPISKVSVENGLQAQKEAAVFAFSDLPKGPHQLVAGEGREARSFVFDAGSAPVLRLAVFSDRNVGGLLVTTGLERFQVFLDGVQANGTIRDGSMTIPNLAAKAYHVRVAADGYEAAPERDTIVKKGGLATEQFRLTQLAQYAALSVRGVPPRTQVLLDGSPLSGAADADGNFSAEKIAPGDHNVEFRNAPQYKAVAVRKTFVKRETTTIADVRLDPSPAEVTISVVPENAQVEFQCGQQAPLQRTRANVAIACAEAKFTARGTAEGYREDIQTIALSPGSQPTVKLALTRIPTAVITPKKSCSSTELGGRGWTLDQGWSLAGSSGATFPCEDLAGTYEFSIRLAKNILGPKPVTWKIQAGGAVREFVFEKKSFGERGRERKEVGLPEKETAIPVRIVVEPDRLVQYIRVGDNWEQVQSTPGEFRKVKVLFPKETRIYGFTFNER